LPFLNITFCKHTLNEGQLFFVTGKSLDDGLDNLRVVFIEGHKVDGIKQVLEVILNGRGVRPVGEDSKQSLVRAEEESWEDASLTFKVSIELLLAQVEVLLKQGKLILEDVVLAALHNVLALGSGFHDFDPLLVNVLEDL
jgi:hypothetical protein